MHTLRPMTTGEILDAAIRTYAGNFLTFAGLGALQQVPQLIISVTAAWALPDLNPWLRLGGRGLPSPERALAELFGAVALLAVVAVPLLLAYAAVSPLLTGAMIHAAGRALHGERPGLLRALKGALPAWGPLLVNTLVYWLLLGAVAVAYYLLNVGVLVGAALTRSTAAIMSGVAAALLLGLLFALAAGGFSVYMYTYKPATVHEAERYLAPLARSFRLVRGRFWRTLGLVLTVWLGLAVTNVLANLPGSLLAYVTSDRRILTAATALTALGAVLVAPVGPLVATLAYFDLRVRKEGYDIEQMAAALPPPATPPATPPAAGP